jgi:hypothetical protein
MSVTKEERFITFPPGVNIKKPFVFVADYDIKKAWVFVPGKPFRPDLMFVDKLKSLA